jgi:hypothetical protein
MNENHLVHIPSCSATNIVPNLFVRFCQRHERFERLEQFKQAWKLRRGTVYRSFEVASDTVEREPSRAIDEAGLTFQLRKAKEKSSRALRKFRRLTIHPMLHSIIALTAR